MNNMKYRVFLSKEFKKQYKKLIYSGNVRTLEKLDKVVDELSSGELLSEKYHNHFLKGNFEGCFECHVLPDWLLIYRKYEDILVLELVGTGTHSELF